MKLYGIKNTLQLPLRRRENVIESSTKREVYPYQSSHILELSEIAVIMVVTEK